MPRWLSSKAKYPLQTPSHPKSRTGVLALYILFNGLILEYGDSVLHLRFSHKGSGIRQLDSDIPVIGTATHIQNFLFTN